MKEPHPDRRAGQPVDAGLIAKHLRIGWWSLAVFGLVGLALETLHAFKIGAYLDAGNDTRRLMWTLSHAHGTLLGLIHLGFASTIRTTAARAAGMRSASAALTSATLLLPGGFALGGLRFYSGDPGVGIVLVPIGAVLLIYAAVVTARDCRTAA